MMACFSASADLVRHVARQRDQGGEPRKHATHRGDAESGAPAQPRVVTYDGRNVCMHPCSLGAPL